MTRVKLQADAPANTEPLHTKYRPKSLKDVIGQEEVTRSIESALKSKARPHTFLFTGPAGTGKTTLARIVAARLDCDMAGVVEVDAASTSGIDDMRRITDTLRYNGFGDSPNKAIILNECQGLSKQAWDSLLTSTEEPPPHVFFFFTSTHPEKIPKAMMTRCVSYHLRAVGRKALWELLSEVCDLEGYATSDDILDMVADAAEGSPRNALTMLAKVHDVEDAKEASVLLQQPLDNAEVIDVCRMLVKGDLQWKHLTETLKALGDVPAETVRIIIVNYLNACISGARSDKDAVRLLDILENFMKPCNASDKLAPIYVAFGRVMFD